MDKETALFEKRLKELSDTAFHKNYVTFTDFLSLHELNIFHTLKQKGFFGQTVLYGGYEAAERQMVAFLPDAFCDAGKEIFPMAVVKIVPLNQKFADSLSHRDYLGAILNLGIDRGKTGDILVMEDGARVICDETLAPFLTAELTRIKHTSVRPDIVPMQEFTFQPRYEVVRDTVASVRLDSMLSLAFGVSRSRLSELIRGGRVFVDGRMVCSNSYEPKPGERISVRGMGKFQFCETGKMSRKGRIYITLHKYI